MRWSQVPCTFDTAWIRPNAKGYVIQFEGKDVSMVVGHDFPTLKDDVELWCHAVAEAAKRDPEVITWSVLPDLDQLFKEHLRGGK